MKTRWTNAVNRELPLPEYPRPQMQRREWINLNGKWEYAITKTKCLPLHFDGEILVPFSPETELSGVNRALQKDEYLIYRRALPIFHRQEGKRILLHFGAVDQSAEVYVNDNRLAEHIGGYTAFSVDITDSIHDGINVLTVIVTDDTDAGSHSRGKQRTRRGGIWYTPQSGIWQTVWMESVPERYIAALRITPDFETGCVSVSAETVGHGEARAVFEGVEYVLPARIPVRDYEPWSPENPKLYFFTVKFGEDEVQSYFAMRKLSVEKDAEGKARLFLNNRPYFHNGLLDQGYWPDGLYTAPTDEALIYDIETAKAMGFNMLRKHIKIEPMRWYYHCDRLGMIVWQDMPNGGGSYNPLIISAPLVTGIHLKDSAYRLFARGDAGGRNRYMAELEEMVKQLYNCPCIVLWTPFNEGWGQFDAARAYALIRRLDATRIIDHASGWHDQGIGEVRSEHVYFRSYKFKADARGRATLLSEFGGYNRKIEGHCFNSRNFGYHNMASEEKLRAALTALYQGELAEAKRAGLSAAVYTQLSDVEDELNGLITYDREVVKISPNEMRNIVDVGD